ncbi:MAG: hypothetical protein V1748_00005, partial [Actinomycetota bacterium]
MDYPGSSSPARKRVARLLAVALLFTILLAGPVPPAPHARAAGAPGKVVIVVIDRVGITTLDGTPEMPSADTPFLLSLAERWSFGLMATRSGDRAGIEGADGGGEYVSLGAGSRARGAALAEFSFDSGEEVLGGETAGGFFRRHTGMAPPGDGVVCLGFQEIERANGGRAIPGTMGERLAEHGIKTAVVGNADDLEGPRRLCPLICCDVDGAVSLGLVGDELARAAPGAAGGLETDSAKLVEQSRLLLAEADLLVVDTGDTARVDAQASVSAGDQIETERRRALLRADDVARQVWEMIDPRESMMLVLSPGAPVDARARGNMLTPVIAAGKGFGAGYVTSRSTRRQGLVDNTDVLPTVLSFFDIAVPSGVIGSKVTATAGPVEGRIERLRGLSTQLGVTREVRWPLMIVYLLLVVAALLLAGAASLASRGGLRWLRNPRGLAGFLAPVMPVLLAVPLSFLVVSAFRYGGYLFPVAFCSLFSIAVGVVSWAVFRRRERLGPVVFVCLLTGSVQLVDILTGGRLLLLPLLGNSALEGMRFFGMPNSYAALFIAVALWAVAGLARGDVQSDRRTRVIAGSALAAVALVTGLGSLGANLGAFIAAAATFLVFFVAVSDLRFTWWRSAAIAAATAGAMVMVVILDMLFFRSHEARAVSGGVSGFWSIFESRLAIHIGELRYFLVPSLLLIAAVIAVALWMRRPGSAWASAWERERWRMAAFFSLLTGSLVAFFLEDTGIAMMGVMMLVSTLVLSY